MTFQFHTLVDGVSVTATLATYHLFLHYVTSVRGWDHSVTHVYKFSTHSTALT